MTTLPKNPQNIIQEFCPINLICNLVDEHSKYNIKFQHNCASIGKSYHESGYPYGNFCSDHLFICRIYFTFFENTAYFYFAGFKMLIFSTTVNKTFEKYSSRITQNKVSFHTIPTLNGTPASHLLRKQKHQPVV